MSKTLQQIRDLVDRGQVQISNHGYDELAEDGILANEVIVGVQEATVVEDYPTYGKGPCVLVLQADRTGKPIHVVWGIPRGADGPAVVITAYRPAPEKWTQDYLRRR